MTLRVLVTGAATGIGRSIADSFAQDGNRVHVCDNAAEHIDECLSESPSLSATQCDVSNVEQIEKLFRDVQKELGGLDVLVNNAGIAGPTAPVEDIEPGDWNKTVEVGLNGAFYCSRLAVPLLKQNTTGSIVNISSTAGIMGFPLRTPYAAAKWGIIGLTKSLAMELGRFNIRVNAVCPGSVDGPRMDRVIAADAKAQGVAEDEIRQAYKNQASMQTFIDRQDIANTVVFLCSEKGNKISGQVISVDGHGETLRTQEH
ncbi:MAG: SDR family oxidoreductase [Gammaproteobacteria bacterium]|nr:SDR family oxidoreductase [Gammaproteobacteria bacterium]